METRLLKCYKRLLVIIYKSLHGTGLDICGTICPQVSLLPQQYLTGLVCSMSQKFLLLPGEETETRTETCLQSQVEIQTIIFIMEGGGGWRKEQP